MAEGIANMCTGLNGTGGRSTPESPSLFSMPRMYPIPSVLAFP